MTVHLWCALPRHILGLHGLLHFVTAAGREDSYLTFRKLIPTPLTIPETEWHTPVSPWRWYVHYVASAGRKTVNTTKFWISGSPHPSHRLFTDQGEIWLTTVSLLYALCSQFHYVWCIASPTRGEKRQIWSYFQIQHSVMASTVAQIHYKAERYTNHSHDDS